MGTRHRSLFYFVLFRFKSQLILICNTVWEPLLYALTLPQLAPPTNALSLKPQLSANDITSKYRPDSWNPGRSILKLCN